ncbi:tetratricopeptide repeat protein [Nitrospinota bacterium]
MRPEANGSAQITAARMNEAVRFQQAGNLEKAEEICGDILEKTPSHFGALHLSGVLAFQRGRLERAASICHSILKVRPKDTPALLLLGVTQAQEGRLAAAERTIRKVLELNPHNEDANRQIEGLPKIREQWRNQPYVQNFLKLRDTYMDYPRFIAIETVGRCNAKCSFCPNSELDRKFSKMPDELFEKIVRDLQEIPSHVPIWILPHLVNEPFMDKKLFDRLYWINESVPNAKLLIYTNLNILPKAFPEKFRKLDNIAGINVSFNAANEADYTKIMCIDFQRTVDNITRLMKENRMRCFMEPPVILSRVKAGSHEDKLYVEECLGILLQLKGRRLYFPCENPIQLARCN